MKYYSSIFLTLLAVASMVVGCKESPYITGPGNNDNNADSLVVVIADTSGISISIDSALTICQNLTPGTTTAERYKLTGVIMDNTTVPRSVPNLSTTINFDIKDANGNIITCQYTNNLNNRPFLRSTDVPYVGTELTVVGPLYLYEKKDTKGNITLVPQIQNGFIAEYCGTPIFTLAKDPEPTPDPEGCDVPEGTLNVYEACDIGEKLASGALTDEPYFIKGFIRRFDEKNHASGIQNHGNAAFYITATNDVNAPISREFEAYQVYGKNGKKITDLSSMEIGDFVLIKGKITNYNGKIETEGQGAAYIYSSTNQAFGTWEAPHFPGCPAPAEGQISVSQAIQLAGQLASGGTSTEIYDILGVVTEVSDVDPSYGNATFNISDNGRNSFICFRVKSINGEKFTATDQVQVGDTVVVRSKLLNYKGTTPETATGGVLVSSTNPAFEGIEIPVFPGCPAPAEGQISVSQALTLLEQLGADVTSTEVYDILGVVTSVSDVDPSYGNATFNISDNGRNSFTCYRIKSLNGAKFTSKDQVLVGDTVVVRSKIVNYKGNTPETASGGVLVSSSNPNVK
ncbi:MAG: hypothetical protein ACI30A_00155 [Paludibacteraceae bacterium]